MISMIMAIAIFVIMFGLIIWDKIERHIVTLACGLARESGEIPETMSSP